MSHVEWQAFCLRDAARRETSSWLHSVPQQLLRIVKPKLWSNTSWGVTVVTPCNYQAFAAMGKKWPPLGRLVSHAHTPGLF